MKKMFISSVVLVPLIPLTLMFLSAHDGNVAYTCAMGFVALYLLIFASLHDINVSLFNILRVLITVIDEEENEDECTD